MDFTFYGDLLGISAAYRLSSKAAYTKLNEYYNTSFSCLSGLCAQDKATVQMFSDSLLMWGSDPVEAVERLMTLYVDLSRKHLLLRGAVVKGTIDFDPRFTIRNFMKQLPKEDTLAKAVGLESTQKGSRLLVHQEVAQQMLTRTQDWLTVDGYARNPKPGTSMDDVRRRICPTPDGQCYEILYFWQLQNQQSAREWYKTQRDNLSEAAAFLGKEAQQHYKETLNLLRRCELREVITYRKLKKQRNLTFA